MRSLVKCTIVCIFSRRTTESSEFPRKFDFSFSTYLWGVFGRREKF